MENMILLLMQFMNYTYLLNQSKVFEKLTSLIKSTLSTDRLALEVKRKNETKIKISQEIDKLLQERIAVNNLELKEKIDKQYNQLLTQYERIDTDIENLKARQFNSLSVKDRLEKILLMLNNKKITPEMLNKDIIEAFFYKIFVCGKNELVFVINATHTIDLNELIKNRKEIINYNPIYENEFTQPDPIKKQTMKYKVVVV